MLLSFLHMLQQLFSQPEKHHTDCQPCFLTSLPTKHNLPTNTTNYIRKILKDNAQHFKISFISFQHSNCEFHHRVKVKSASHASLQADQPNITYLPTPQITFARISRITHSVLKLDLLVSSIQIANFITE
jgi:hypothetical protein